MATTTTTTTFKKAQDCLMSRLKSLTRMQKRFNHTLKPKFHPESEIGPDYVTHPVDVSKWKKVDSRIYGISRYNVPLSSLTVLKILKGGGFQAYLVGGCVRDLILNRTPKDFDVITTANLKEVRKQFYRCQIVGRRFPICRVHIKDTVIEVSSFETVAKHAEGTSKALSSQMLPRDCDKRDLVRWRNSMHRDFTVNSLFYDPLVNTIYDYANGMEDLRSLKLQTLIPAYLSFREDCARILRGVRIAARLGLSFSRDAVNAIRNLSSSIERLDKSRLLLELNYMLSYGAAEPSICLLHRFELLKFLLPFHAAYLDQQASKTPAQNPMMLMKLLFNLDKLVSCDQPADCTLWVGLLAFHQTLVNNPQDALVVLTFASVLYHGEWKAGVEFAREHATEQVKFIPEISTFSKIKSDEKLAQKVTHLASLVQECVKSFAEADMVFVSNKIERDVVQIFDIRLDAIESYKEGRESFMIDYRLLGKGDRRESRFVLGKIILGTISRGLLGGEGQVEEEEKNHQQLEVAEESQLRLSDMVKKQFEVKKNRQRDPAPPKETVKKRKLVENKSCVLKQEQVEEKNPLQLEVIGENCNLTLSDIIKSQFKVENNIKHDPVPPDSELSVETKKKRRLVEKKSCVLKQEQVEEEEKNPLQLEVIEENYNLTLSDMIKNHFGVENNIKDDPVPPNSELSVEKPKKRRLVEKSSVLKQEQVEEEETNPLQLEVNGEDCHNMVKNQSKAKKNKKRDPVPPNPVLRLKTAKRRKRKLVEKDSVLKQEHTVNKQGVILTEESQQKGKEHQKVVESCHLPERETNVPEENMLKKKDSHSSPQEVTGKKIDKRKKVIKENTGRKSLSSLFR